MSILSLEEFYGQSTGVKEPWKVASVAIHPLAKQVEIVVTCQEGIAWVDPETGGRAHIKDWQEREWSHLDTCDFQTIVRARIPRIKLNDGRTVMVSVPWAEPGGRFTRRFEAKLIDYISESKTVRGAARLASLTPDQIDGVIHRAVARGLLRRELQPLHLLGLDEKAYRKGHNYVTLLNDLENNRVIDVAKERTEETAKKLINSLPETNRQEIKAVAMDMWPAYQNAVAAALPKADVVFDRYHISAHLNKGVDSVRRSERRRQAASGDQTLAKTKYLWLHNRLDLRTKVGIQFRALLNQDLQTATAWGLKENFHRFWSYRSWACASTFLERWTEAARDSGLRPIAKIADMIDKHAEGLLNYIHHGITNAASEGLNSAIQLLRANARGLPNFASFRARILFFLGKLDLKPA
jgi:transposase